MKKLLKHELIILVSKIVKGGYMDEEDLNEDLDLLLFNANDPEITNYIYDIKYNLTPEEIVEKALSYKPIQLSDLSKKNNV